MARVAARPLAVASGVVARPAGWVAPSRSAGGPNSTIQSTETSTLLAFTAHQQQALACGSSLCLSRSATSPGQTAKCATDL